MKISSLASSSSSPSSFDGNLSNSRNAAAGCFTGIFRRLLCSGGLPTYPSDHIREGECAECDHRKEVKVEEKIEAPATPGIVARLMGLESMPELNWVSPGKAPDSICRSRSVNSADYWSEFDLMQGRHRRVRTSLSFREVPTFLELENEDFFLLSFDNVVETKDLVTKGRNSEMGFGKLKQGSAETNQNKEKKREAVSPEKKNKKKKEDQGSKKRVCNEKKKPERRISDRPSRKVKNCGESRDSGQFSPPKKDVYRKTNAISKTESPSTAKTNKEASSERTKSTKKKKSPPAVKKIEPECNSENSSPVSVLDLGDFLIHPQATLSEEDVKPRGSNSRRKLSPELAMSDSPSPHFTNIVISNDRESEKINSQITESKKTIYHSNDYLESWVEICKFAEEDVKASNWISGEISKLKEFEEIGIEFGLQILDRLLLEIIGEFHILPSKNFTLCCV